MRKYFITFLALLTVLAISCNNRPTAVSNFVEADETKSETNATTGQTSLTIANTANANNPVVVANGDKIILAWENNSKIQYMTSANGGKDGTRSQVQTLASSSGSTVKNPHIFFKSDDSVVVVATIGAGDISLGYTETPIVNLNGTFQNSGNGIYTIRASGLWSVAGLRENDSSPGSPNGWPRILINNGDYGTLSSGNVRTVAGAGRISGSTLTLPIRFSAASENEVFAIKVTSTDGNIWTLASSKITDNTDKTKDYKYKADGSAVLSGDAGKSFESAKGGGSTEYEIAANGTITGGSSLSISGNNISESSIAVLSDGTVVTFTKESSGLVFRRIAVN